MSEKQATSSDNQVMDEAINWLSMQEGGRLSRQQHQHFMAWLNRDARHQAAFEQAKGLWHSVEVAETARLLAQETPVPAQQKKAHWKQAAVAACLLMGVIWAGFGLISDPLARFQADQMTAVGEQRWMELDDGSEVLLNTASALSVALDATQRHTVLHQGEAFFQVAKDAQRPFLVEAGPARVTVLGTAFTVRHLDEVTQVSVLEGRVAVQGSAGSVELLAADLAVIAADGRIEVKRQGARSQDFSWVHQRLIFEDVAFGDMIRDVQRYQSSRIWVLGDALSQARVTGNFSLQDPQRAIDGLAGIQQAEVYRVGRYLTLIRR